MYREGMNSDIYASYVNIADMNHAYEFYNDKSIEYAIENLLLEIHSVFDYHQLAG